MNWKKSKNVKKKYEVKVHYNVCFIVNVESESANKAVQEAIQSAMGKDLYKGEITNVEAYVNNQTATNI